MTNTRYRVNVNLRNTIMSDYYTVTEFAKLYNKDPGNVRRMLIKGAIKGEKLGNRWIIPKSTLCPDDGRLRSGAYRNWRKRSVVNRYSPGLLQDLMKMSREIGEIFGDSAYKVILYGSYSRGEQTDESDVDIAVLLKPGSTETMHDKMIDIVVDYELSLAVTLSVVPIDYTNYIEWREYLPFYKNIDKEGIVLWKKE